MSNSQIPGYLEVDHGRGVIYFHVAGQVLEALQQATVLRLGGLPAPIPSLIGRQLDVHFGLHNNSAVRIGDPTVSWKGDPDAPADGLAVRFEDAEPPVVPTTEDVRATAKRILENLVHYRSRGGHEKDDVETVVLGLASFADRGQTLGTVITYLQNRIQEERADEGVSRDSVALNRHIGQKCALEAELKRLLTGESSVGNAESILWCEPCGSKWDFDYADGSGYKAGDPCPDCGVPLVSASVVINR